MRFFKVIKAYQNQDILIPKRQTKNSAGYDLAAAEDVEIPPKSLKLIPTGLKASMSKNEVLLIYARSSLGIKKGLILSNGVGVIDADYYDNPDNEGHLMVALYNLNDHIVHIKKNERIAQGVFTSFLTTNDEHVSFETRKGGFGSSGS